LRAALLMLLLITGCAAQPGASSPSAEGLAPVSPQTAASATPSAEATSSAPPASASAIPDGVIEVDALIRTAVDRLRIREDPGLARPSLGTLAEGEIGYVLAGPVSADGFDWYLVSALGLPYASGCITPISTDPFDCPTW